MLTKKLKELREQLLNMDHLNQNQKELLYELNFFNNNDEIKKIITEQYSIRKIIMESFAIAPSNCPVCGKKI